MEETLRQNQLTSLRREQRFGTGFVILGCAQRISEREGRDRGTDMPLDKLDRLVFAADRSQTLLLLFFPPTLLFLLFTLLNHLSPFLGIFVGLDLQGKEMS